MDFFSLYNESKDLFELGFVRKKTTKDDFSPIGTLDYELYNTSHRLMAYISYGKMVYPKKAFTNIKNMLYLYGNKVYGPRGFYDTVNMEKDTVMTAYSTTTPASIFICIVNIMTHGKKTTIIPKSDLLGRKRLF
ncbi:hypothetical protein AB834_06130 [PVC group bacterium (ex Bugula neritina AB1)]|nr:hypothetical protein AB834_06130 [PVC group bacterium (ex Bugula neritina AB1)]